MLAVESLRPISEETGKKCRPIEPWPRNALIGVSTKLDNSLLVLRQYGTNEANGFFDQYLHERLAEKLLGAKESKDGTVLSCPASDYNALVLRHSCNGKLRYDSEATYLFFLSLLYRWQMYYDVAKIQALYKSDAELTPLAMSFPNPEGYEAANYQRVAADCAVRVPGYAFHMKQGTGKTFASIIAIDYLAREYNKAIVDAERKKPFRFVIVAPKNVLYNWEHELKTFSTCRGKVVVVRGTRKSRARKFTDFLVTHSSQDDKIAGYDWVCAIMTYGVLKNDISVLLHVDWDAALLDEAHNIMNARTDVARAAHALRNKCKRRYTLTGTPHPNKVSELFSQLEFLGKGFSGCTTKAGFAESYSQIVNVSNGEISAKKEVLGVNNINILQEKLVQVSFTISKEEALEGLPPKVYNYRSVDMIPEQAAMYKKVLKHIIVESEEALADSEGDNRKQAMVLQNVLKKMLRLSQITSGFYVTDAIYDDDGALIEPSVTHRFDPNPKIEELMSVLKPKPITSKSIVWSCWTQDIRTVMARLQIENIKCASITGKTSPTARWEILEAFNNTHDIQVLVANPAAGGEGVNALGQADDHTNCDHLHYLSRNYSSKAREQSEDRSHRRGTRCVVEVTDYIVPCTIDQEIVESVVNKRVQSARLQDVQNMLRRLSDNLDQM